MSTFRFSIHDYHAIKTADIEIDSISVIAGVNGTGKSTISKWLYYMVCGMTEYIVACRKNILNAALTITTSTAINLAELRHEQGKLNNMESLLLSLDVEALDYDQRLETSFKLFLEDMNADLQYLLEARKDESEKNRILKALLKSYDKSYIISEHKQTVSDIIRYTRETFEKWFEQYKQAVSRRNSEQLRRQIIKTFKEQNAFPEHIGLCEEEVPLYNNDTFAIPLMLKRAIYIDSPMTLSEQSDGSKGVMWHRLTELVKSENHNEKVSSFVDEINTVIGGKIGYAIDPITKVSNVTYTLTTGERIRIANAATGVKSFAYIIRLLECGALDDSALLIIDEPEAHLHPQWIVDYARILVILAKEYGVKIVLASHSSMMVSAIKYIAEKQELPRVIFYNAEEVDGKYNFVCQGNDIEDIFHSFNISYDKLDGYAEYNHVRLRSPGRERICNPNERQKLRAE